MQEREYWLGFSVFPGIGPKRFLEVLEHFGSAKDAWNATNDDLLPVLKPALTKQFLIFRKTFSFDAYEAELGKANVSFVTLDDPVYPEKLRSIENPPFVLYYKGDIDIFRASETSREEGSRLRSNSITVGVVGTRLITSYGKEVTEIFVTELVNAGCVIVSGLALGVDAVAHKTTIDTKGITIAVLGCGVDCCSPMENQALYEEIIASGGVIVSEFPLSQKPSIGSFPSRNRIISGLSDAVLVTEGAEDSGSLITAQRALEQGRKVFAVPGPITSNLSKGPLKLIQEGAKLVTNGEQILEELGVARSAKSREQKEIKGETEEEQKIIDLLQNESLHFDEIVKHSGFQTIQLGSLLSLMEMKGFIKNDGAGSYSLT